MCIFSYEARESEENDDVNAHLAPSCVLSLYSKERSNAKMSAALPDEMMSVSTSGAESIVDTVEEPRVPSAPIALSPKTRAEGTLMPDGSYAPITLKVPALAGDEVDRIAQNRTNSLMLLGGIILFIVVILTLLIPRGNKPSPHKRAFANRSRKKPNDAMFHTPTAPPGDAPPGDAPPGYGPPGYE